MTIPLHFLHPKILHLLRFGFYKNYKFPAARMVLKTLLTMTSLQWYHCTIVNKISLLLTFVLQITPPFHALFIVNVSENNRDFIDKTINEWWDDYNSLKNIHIFHSSHLKFREHHENASDYQNSQCNEGCNELQINPAVMTVSEMIHLCRMKKKNNECVIANSSQAINPILAHQWAKWYSQEGI